MSLKFTITDYTTNPAGVSTVIDEPVGWDAISLRLKRDAKWRGFFDFFDDAIGELKFTGRGFNVLKTAYDTYGLDSHVELRIEYACADTDNYTTVYTGRFVFENYTEACGDMCYASAGVEAIGCLMKFRNRLNQKVDLDSLNAFDTENFCEDVIDIKGATVNFTAVIFLSTTFTIFNYTANPVNVGRYLIISSSTVGNNGIYKILSITPSGADSIIVVDGILDLGVGATADFKSGCLEPYKCLGKEIVLPSQSLRFISRWDMASTSVFEMDLLVPFVIDSVPNSKPNFTPIIPSTKEEILDTLVGTGIAQNQKFADDEIDKFIDFKGANLKCAGVSEFKININANLIDHADCPGGLRPLSWKLIIIKAPEWRGIFNVYDQPEIAGPNRWEFKSTNSSLIVNESILFGSFNEGDKIWVTFQFDLDGFLPNTGEDVPENCFPDLQIVGGSYFEFVLDTTCNPTTAKTYLVNETLSRITEIYTADCMRVYSDYYGRTDAKPYTSIADGCGAMRSISNGLLIRDATTSARTQPTMTISMQEMLDALSAIDNIGMSIEADPNRPGNDLVRIEPVKYFFNHTILMTCQAVNELKKSLDSDIVYSLFKSGYAKYETWNNNGLYDIFGKREYRTDVSGLRNELNKECTFIASNYAIEVTRRLYGKSTSDWRYDNDIFILCLTKQVKTLATFVTGGGPNIITLLEVQWLEYFNVGDSITITGSAGNDGTYNIISVAIVAGELRIGVSVALSAESFAPVTIVNNTNGFYSVEVKAHDPENILYPDELINFRISPARNAMRWYKSIANSKRNYATAELKFTNGTGNLLASGKTFDTSDSCAIESTPITENTDIKAELFNYADEATPLYWPETVTFEYPVTWQQYLAIKANPYGLIGYQCGNGPMQYGWIEDFQLKPYTGMGQFTLRPKIES